MVPDRLGAHEDSIIPALRRKQDPVPPPPQKKPHRGGEKAVWVKHSPGACRTELSGGVEGRSCSEPSAL